MIEESPNFDSFVPTARRIGLWAAKRVYERYRKIKRIEFDDLFSVAFAAVWIAWKEYDPDAKATLGTHCCSKAIWACHDYCRTFLSRCGSREKFFLPDIKSLNAPASEEKNAAEIGEVVLFEPDFTEDLFLDQEEAWGYLDCVDHRSRFVLIEHVMKGRTLFDIGDEMSLTFGRVSQIKTAAIRYINEHHRKESA